MALTINEFEQRLKGGRYDRAGDARRAVSKLVVSNKMKERALEAVESHFSKAPVAAAPPSQGFSTRLGDVARYRRPQRGVSMSPSAVRSREYRARVAQLAEGAAPPAHQLALVAPPPPPTQPAPPSHPAPVSLADVRSEADRMVRELASRMPVAPATPPAPEGIEHAFRVIADASRDLFESLREAVKEDERLRPDYLRAARAVSHLVEAGSDVLKSKLAPSPPPPVVWTPPAPPSTERVGEAAQ